MTEPTFYLVWCAEMGPAHFKHESLDQARDEAARLAARNPGKKFVVLASIGHAIRETASWVPHDHNPF